MCLACLGSASGYFLGSHSRPCGLALRLWLRPCLPMSAPAGITSIKRAFKEVTNGDGPLEDPPPPELADVVARGCHPSSQEGNLRKNTRKESSFYVR
jgi:hypothetical protein